VRSRVPVGHFEKEEVAVGHEGELEVSNNPGIHPINVPVPAYGAGEKEIFSIHGDIGSIF